MMAREKWQIQTIAMLERVFEERVRQQALHGDAMDHLPDGTGPKVHWMTPLTHSIHPEALHIQQMFRGEYEEAQQSGRLTRMHLVREEIAEAFELDGDDPAFVEEILQVAALCVQWAEIKAERFRK